MRGEGEREGCCAGAGSRVGVGGRKRGEREKKERGRRQLRDCACARWVLPEGCDWSLATWSRCSNGGRGEQERETVGLHQASCSTHALLQHPPPLKHLWEPASMMPQDFAVPLTTPDPVLLVAVSRHLHGIVGTTPTHPPQQHPATSAPCHTSKPTAYVTISVKQCACAKRDLSAREETEGGRWAARYNGCAARPCHRAWVASEVPVQQAQLGTWPRGACGRYSQKSMHALTRTIPPGRR